MPQRYIGRRSILYALVLALVVVGHAFSQVRLLQRRSVSDVPPVKIGLPRLADDVVVVVLDAVGRRIAFDPEIMPGLVGLAEQGTSGRSWAPEESNTAAGVLALGAGVKTDPADLLGLFHATEYTAWTVFDGLVARDETVSFQGDSVWRSFFGSRGERGALGRHTGRFYTESDSLAEAAARLEADDPPALTIVHLAETDRLSHLYGTDRPEYRTGMREVDRRLTEFQRRIGAPGRVLIITTDHGADHNGNHGGPGELYQDTFVVMVGSGISRGHRIDMNAKALPGILAVLLGLRIPGSMMALIPVGVFEVSPATASVVALANARQLEALANDQGMAFAPEIAAGLDELAASHAAARYAEVIDAQRQWLPRVLSAITNHQPPVTERFLWVGILLALVTVVALRVLAPSGGRHGMAVDAALGGAGLLALVVALLPVAAQVPVMSCVLFMLAGSIFVTGLGSTRLGLAVGASCALTIGVATVAAIRFAYMDEVKELVKGGSMGTLAVLGLGGLGLVSFAPAASALWKRLEGSEALWLGGAALALAMVRPFSAVPVIVLGATVMALRAGDVEWRHVAWIGAGLAVFFLLCHRLVFAASGEDPATRYAYSLAVVAPVIAGLLWRLGRSGSRLAYASLCLLPLWPFGYAKLVGNAPSAGVSILVVVATLAATATLGIRRGLPRIIWAAPLGALAFHLQPTHFLFWCALGAHLVALLATRLSCRSMLARHSATAMVSLSGLVLMSRTTDLMSLPLLAFGLLLAGQLVSAPAPRASIVVLGAALVTWGGYAFVDIFQHEPETYFSLQNLDLSSGFYGFDEPFLMVAVALISLKMAFAVMSVVASVLASSSLRAVGRSVLIGSSLLVLAFVLQASVEAALSFGDRASGLSAALGAAGFHTIVLLALGLGCLGYVATVGRLIDCSGP